MHFNASLLLMINIGEHASKLSEELRARYPLIPFQLIRGLRNRIAHDYTGIDYEMVFDIARKSIPAIKLQLVELLQNEISSKRVDTGELNAARHSPFYRHVDFHAFGI